MLWIQFTAIRLLQQFPFNCYLQLLLMSCSCCSKGQHTGSLVDTHTTYTDSHTTCAKKSWAVEPGNEATHTHTHTPEGPRQCWGGLHSGSRPLPPARGTASASDTSAGVPDTLQCGSDPRLHVCVHVQAFMRQRLCSSCRISDSWKRVWLKVRLGPG